MKKIAIAQFVILLLGTAFAWVNFFLELNTWIKSGTCTIGCAATVSNPFLTPCFYGALFFTASFVLNVIILFRNNK